MTRQAVLEAPAPLLCAVLALMLVALPACTGASSEADAEADAEAASAEPSGGGGDGDSSAKPEEVESEAEGAEEPKKKKKRKEQSTSVTAAEVSRGQLVLPVIAEGSIRARRKTEVRFEITGHVTGVLVREGQRVKKGQELARLDDREVRLALEEARSRYLQGLGQLAVEEEGYAADSAERVLEAQTADLIELEAKGELTRDQRLDRELELGMEAVRDGAYRRELLEVRSGLAMARADTDRLKIDLERTVIKAPFAGVITGLNLTEGERVQVGEPLCRLVDDVNLEAEVGVLESDLAQLAVGRPALLTLPAVEGAIQVKIDVISPDVDEDSRTCSVLMRLKSKGQVKPGMFVRAAIAGRVFDDRLLVPREAILTRDGRPVLFKVADGRALWVYVQLGERNDHFVEIERIDQGGPLEPGTLVVVDNHLTLTHEAKVKVKKTTQVADPWVAEQG